MNSIYMNISRVFILSILVSVPAIGDLDYEDVTGTWASSGFGSKVQIEACDPADLPTELCGRITWLWNALDENGTALTDANNSDRAARGRALIGIRILSGFRKDSDGVWRGGKVYNPDDGRTYSGSIQSTGNGLLELKGCALKIFCQTQLWRRTRDVCTGTTTLEGASG